jgi:hypothetical protein
MNKIVGHIIPKYLNLKVFYKIFLTDYSEKIFNIKFNNFYLNFLEIKVIKKMIKKNLLSEENIKIIFNIKQKKLLLSLLKLCKINMNDEIFCNKIKIMNVRRILEILTLNDLIFHNYVHMFIDSANFYIFLLKNREIVTEYFLNSFRKSSKKVCLISGKKRSGKSTFAKYDKKFKYKFAIADKLKKMSFNILKNISGAACEICDDKKDKQFFDIKFRINTRKFLQTMGDISRDIYPNIWIKLLHKKMKKYNTYEKFLITDVRFKDEINYLKKKYKNVKLLRIKRTNNNIDTHDSEKINFEYDDIIMNNGSLEDFIIKINNYK